MKYNSKYKKSMFNIVQKVQEGYLFYNTANTALGLLEDSEYIFYNNCQFDKLKPATLTTLIESNFLVDINTDEYDLQQKIREYAMNHDSEEMTSITIAPTLACNARCYYCYERGVKFETMTHETAKQLVDFILQNMNKDNKIELVWHGGEPLIAADTITYICEELTKKGIEITSIMNSNGILFDQKMIELAKNSWHLQDVQITIDGIGKDYNNIKKYVGIKGDAFELIIKNIENLLDNDIAVSLRHNYEYENYQNAIDVIRYLYELFKNKKNLYIYAHPIFGQYSKNLSIYGEPPELTVARVINEYHSGDGISHTKLKLRHSYCSAIRKKKIFVRPDGSYSKCERYVQGDDQKIGNIFNPDIIDYQCLNEWCNASLPYEKCKNCPLIPCCQGSCRASRLQSPDFIKYCDHKFKIIKGLILILYDSLKKN